MHCYAPASSDRRRCDQKTIRTDARWHTKTTGCEGNRYESLAICRLLALARAAFEVAIAEKPAGRFTIRQRIRVVKRHPEGDW
jgi:hypothetical protein